MTLRWLTNTMPPWLALCLMVTPWGTQAQAQETSQQDWRRANETVGQYPRGHADVLRWEQAQTSTPATEAPPPAFALASAPEAIRAAWSVHRELAAPLSRLGPHNVQRIADGDWRGLDPHLQRRIQGVDEVLEVAANTRKAWLSAVAAQQMLPSIEDALTAAEAAAELGRRMVSVGNWSRYQQAQVALGESSARMELQRARLAAHQAESALLKSIGLDTVHHRVALPTRLPTPPASAMTETDFRARLTAIQGQLPPAESRKAGHQAWLAYATYSASLSIHDSHRNGILPQRELVGEETQLRYNGMLESVWGLLSDARERAQAVVAAIGAQRDALIAATDLEWVLQGGQPEALLDLGRSAPGADPKAGH